MNPNTPGEADRLAAKVALGRHRIPKTIAAKVLELSDGGLAPFEIAPHVGLPPALVTLILRAAAPSSSSVAVVIRSRSAVLNLPALRLDGIDLDNLFGCEDLKP